jgi:hypothetical protein
MEDLDLDLLEELAECESQGGGFMVNPRRTWGLRQLRSRKFIDCVINGMFVHDIKLTDEGKAALAAYQLEKM